MHWISLIFSLMLCTPISQSPQHRAVKAALSLSKIAFSLQIASLQRLYRSFCPVWFCTYFAFTSIYHGNMTLQCPGVGGRGRSPLIIPEIRLSITTAVSSGENFYIPICRSLHLLGPFVQRCWARQYLAHAFSELNQKNWPNVCKSLANTCTFSTRDFAASCDTTCKSHFMCASGDGKKSKHTKNSFKDVELDNIWPTPFRN